MKQTRGIKEQIWKPTVCETLNSKTIHCVAPVKLQNHELHENTPCNFTLSQETSEQLPAAHEGLKEGWRGIFLEDVE